MQNEARLEMTEMKKICVNGSVRRYTNPILHMSQPALLCVTAETLVNRLMWQISAATLLFNPVILHQRVAKNPFFSAVVEMERRKEGKNEGGLGRMAVLSRA